MTKGILCIVKTFVRLHMCSAYVIEATNNRREAENGVLEDGELYPDDMPEQELLRILAEDIRELYHTPF